MYYSINYVRLWLFFKKLLLVNHTLYKLYSVHTKIPQEKVDALIDQSILECYSFFPNSGMEIMWSSTVYLNTIVVG